MSAQPQETLGSRQNSLPNPLGTDESNETQSRSNTVKPNQDLTKASKPQPTLVMPEVRAVEKGVSIGVKATVLAAVFGVLPVLTVGAVAYRSADSSVTEQIAQTEISQATELADQLSRYLQERLSNAKTVASIVNTVTRSAGLSNLSENSPERASVLNILTDELTNVVQDYRTYANIAIYDLQGNAIAQSEGSARELNQRQAAYFQQVLDSGQPVVSEPIASTNADGSTRFSIYVAAPVTNASGTVTSVVAGKIPVEFVGNAVLRAASAQQGKTFRLIDTQGNVFQNFPNNDTMQVGTPITDQIPQFPNVNEQRQQQAWLTGGLRNQQLIAYAPVSGLENLEWSVVSATDSDVAFVPQRQLLQAIGLGTLLTAMVAVMLGAVLARSVTTPIQQIASAVERLGRGYLDTRIPVRGKDELAVLGSNVNQMAMQIQTLLNAARQNAEQLSQQNDVLATLARDEALIQGDARAAAKTFTEAIAKTLKVQRVSIWAFSSDRLSLNCLSQYDRSDDQHSTWGSFNVMDVLDYFQALDSLIAASNAQTDPATRSLFSASLVPSDTQSILSVPIQISGQTAGVIRCEQVKTQRSWQAEEQTFVTSVANLVSIALESEFLQQEVSHLLDVVSDVEDGDLTTQARVSDRSTGLVADTFNRLVERLADVMSQVSDAAEQVTNSANQQKSMAEIVATNTEQQAQAVNQVLQLTEQVEQMAIGSVEKVKSTTTSLQTMRLTIEQGQGSIHTLMNGIEVLQEGTDRIVQQMKTLGEFVGLADQFVQDQSQIASLTQTLALNASLVAARASEQRDPRQFAVVAREFDSIANQVGRLAQQTNDGLVTLEQRSSQIHSVVSIIDANIQNMGGLVRGFTQGVDQSNLVFNDIQRVTDAAVIAGETVTQSSQTIVQAAQSAAQVVRNISDLATQTAHLSQQTRLQSEEMNLLSNQLQQSIEFFRLPSTLDDGTYIQPRVDLSESEEQTVNLPLPSVALLSEHLQQSEQSEHSAQSEQPNSPTD